MDDIGDGQYKRLVEGVSEHAIFMLDTAGDISIWPEVAQRFYGHTEMVGQDFEVLFAHRKETEGIVEDLLADAKQGIVDFEQWHERENGTIFWAMCTLSPLSNGHFTGYAVIVRDGTEQKQYERMLERQNDRLKEFTDILSHDLRTPLSVIEWRTELFRETGDIENITVIESTVSRMESLVDDLLKVANQGQVVRSPKPIQLQSVIDLAREGAVPQTATLNYEEVPVLMGDADRIVQLLQNLMTNSVDHSGESVTITIGPLPTGFYFEDNGPGIPEDSREKVFSHGYTTREEGMGYGLSIVRAVVGAHGWDIIITDSEDGGARFEITNIEFVSETAPA